MLKWNRPRRVASAAAAAGLALSLSCVNATTASAATADSTGPSAAAGVIYDSSGRAVGAGWSVTLIAQPNSATMKTLKAGDTVPTKDVSTAVTTSDGSYRLPLPADSVLAPFADSNGTVNMVVQSEAANEPHQYSFSVDLPTQQAGAGAQARTAAAAIATPVVDLKALAAAKSTASTARTAITQGAPIGCGPATVLGTYANRHVQVGEAYTSSGATASFAYTSGASSSLGVGVSTSGASSGFSASGTSDTSSSSTQGFGGISGNNGTKWVTGFTVKKTRQICNSGVTYYRLATSSFDAGNYSEDSTAFSSNANCVPERNGDSFVTENQNAYTFGSGLNVGSLIGINLTAKTGWNSKTVVTFKFSKSMQLCGASGRPGGDARRLKAIP